MQDGRICIWSWHNAKDTMSNKRGRVLSHTVAYWLVGSDGGQPGAAQLPNTGYKATLSSTGRHHLPSDIHFLFPFLGIIWICHQRLFIHIVQYVFTIHTCICTQQARVCIALLLVETSKSPLASDAEKLRIPYNRFCQYKKLMTTKHLHGSDCHPPTHLIPQGEVAWVCARTYYTSPLPSHIHT